MCQNIYNKNKKVKPDQKLKRKKKKDKVYKQAIHGQRKLNGQAL